MKVVYKVSQGTQIILWLSCFLFPRDAITHLGCHLRQTGLDNLYTSYLRIGHMQVNTLDHVYGRCILRWHNLTSRYTLSSAFKLFIQLSLRTVRMPCDFRLAVVFATSTSGGFCKMKNLWKLNLVIISKSKFNKTIIPFALVGFEIGYSQPGPTGLVSYLPSHIQRTLLE